jgi:hypothetical protein
MRTPRLPVIDWTDAPADLNGLVRFAERRNLVSARVPSHFKRSLRYVFYGVTPIQTFGAHPQAITDCPSVKVGWKEEKALKCRVFTFLPEMGQCMRYNDQATEWTIRISTLDKDKRVFFLLLIVQTDSGAHQAYYSMHTGDRAAGAWSWPLTIQRWG